MSEIIIDGFKFMRWPDGKLFLVVESNRLAECVAYCRANNVRWLHITPSHGYRLHNLDFLHDCTHVTGVFLMCEFSNMGGLYSLTNLSCLSAVCDHSIKFSAFTQLSDLSTDWNPLIHEELLASRSLSQLWLRGFKPAGGDLLELVALQSLCDLRVILSTISSIRGVERLPALKRLEFSYCRNLTDIRAIAGLGNSLESLELDHCKGIEDLTQLSVLKTLRKLIVSHCHSLPSLRFVKEMPALEFLSFVNTPVADGDMTPLFGLRYAGFLNKRHYSHSYEEVRGVIMNRKAGDSLYKD